MTLILPSISTGVRHLSRMGCKVAQSLPYSIRHPVSQRILDPLFNNTFYDEDIQFLDGKILCIEVSDIEHREYFTLEAGKISIAQKHEADVTLSGNLKDFISLMKHQVDPDTLFFQRKLMISGDTELGLEVKSLFDYFTWDSLPYSMKKSINILDVLLEETHDQSEKTTLFKLIDAIKI